MLMLIKSLSKKEKMNQNKKALLPLDSQVFSITTNPQLPTTQLPLLLHSFSTTSMMKMQADFWNLNKVLQSSNHSNPKDNNNKKVNNKKDNNKKENNKKVNNNNNQLNNRKKVNSKKTNQKVDNNKKVNRNKKDKKKENNKLNQLKSLMVLIFILWTKTLEPTTSFQSQMRTQDLNTTPMTLMLTLMSL
jgi:hypothetical protein